MKKKKDRDAGARLACILAMIFYIGVSAVALSTVGRDMDFLGSDSLFNGYDTIIFGLGGNVEELDPEDKIEYSQLGRSENEERAEEAALEEEASEEALEEASEEALEASEEASEEAAREEETSLEPSEEVQETEPEEIPAEKEEYFSFSVITGGAKNLNMREAPDINSKVVYVIPFTASGVVLEIGDEWSKVRCNGFEGYCSNELINMTEISKEEYEKGISDEPG